MGMVSGGSLLSMLGTLSSYASAAMPVIRAVSTIKDAVGGNSYDAHAALRSKQDLAMRQLQAQQGLGDISAAEQSALDRQRLSLDTATSEEARRGALRRAVARQRASFGSQGVIANDGSGEAVMLGLFNESENEKDTRNRLDSLRTQAIDQDMADRQRINVLQRTQLQERQNLDRALAGY